MAYGRKKLKSTCRQIFGEGNMATLHLLEHFDPKPQHVYEQRKHFDSQTKLPFVVYPPDPSGNQTWKWKIQQSM